MVPLRNPTSYDLAYARSNKNAPYLNFPKIPLINSDASSSETPK